MKKIYLRKTGAFCLVLAGLAFALFAPAAAARITTESLKVTETKVKVAVQRALPCTVGIVSRNSGGSGSGVIVSKDGLILTAGHVTKAAGDDLTIILTDGRLVKAKALGANYGRDASMVKIVDEGEYPYVELGDSDRLEIDQWCIALGHAEGFQRDRSAPIRLGRVLGPNFMGFLSTDCALIGGDSGGPLFDLDGKLIGIHSNVGMSLSDNHHVPIAWYKKDWDRMLEGERWGRLIGAKMPHNLNRPMLGVLPDGTADDGVPVKVIPDASAAKAGLKDGDVIKSVGRTKTPDIQHLQAAIMDHKAGQEVEVVVQRGEEELKINVQLVRARNVPRTEPPEEPKDRESEKEGAEDVDKLFDKMADEALREGGALKMTPEIMEAIGGQMKFMLQLQRLVRTRKLKPEQVAKLLGRRVGEDVFFRQVIQAYHPVVATASQSVFRLMRGKQQVALATAVGTEGYVLTKASEVKEGEIELVIKGKRIPAQLEQEFPDYDLALMKVNAKLKPITWQTSQDRPALGTFFGAVGPDHTTLAVGLLSVSERSLSAKSKPFLGVALERVGGGLRVLQVFRGSAAQKAGLKPGDVISEMGGKSYDSVEQFIRALQKFKPGDSVKFSYRRDGKELEMDIELGDQSIRPQAPGLGRYPQGGRLSENRGGYPSALQTDLPYRPQDCGSPLVGLDGLAVGINIARAGRIMSYAIPADAIQKLLKDTAVMAKPKPMEAKRAAMRFPDAVNRLAVAL